MVISEDTVRNKNWYKEVIGIEKGRIRLIKIHKIHNMCILIPLLKLLLFNLSKFVIYI